MGAAPEGFPEFFPFTSCVVRAKAPFFDESPALTAVLQAQPRELYQSQRISHSPMRATAHRLHRRAGTVSAGSARNGPAGL
jgi:hypothetical protein